MKNEKQKLQKRPRTRPDRVGVPGTRPERMLQWFAFKDMPEGPMKDTSAQFACLAESVCASIGSCPERTAALRKLLEAKECAVRAVIEAQAINEEFLKMERMREAYLESLRKNAKTAEHIGDMEAQSDGCST